MEHTHPLLFEGCGTALVTPMKSSPASGGGYTPPAVDYDAFTRLVRRQIAGGADALIVCGTTGESPTLTDEEKRNLFSIAVSEARAARRGDAGADGQVMQKSIPVIAGTGSNNTLRAIALSRMAEKVGCDGLLVVTPYYNKASPAGLVAHYTAIADAVSLPIILYHVPSRTGCRLPVEVCAALAAHPRIVGLKEASGQVDFAARVAGLCGDSLPLYSGNDDMTVPLMSLGGRGVISVVSNLYPGKVSRMCQAFREGDTATAARIQAELLPLCDALFADVNPIPVKAALSMLGLCQDALRLPLVPADERVREKLKQVLAIMEA